ncbi:hypothetical protein FKV23_13205 [Lysobacter alkalisoli]|uniref:Uncharacterized protein n=1 Tax=Marilutibacter alkalisoli TaxID=2591633 RepID=A0A514BU86_9GAMM|nr:hypothetical protein FKV23_13205 [Lysobacter alkalisoli]
MAILSGKSGIPGAWLVTSMASVSGTRKSGPHPNPSPAGGRGALVARVVRSKPLSRLRERGWGEGRPPATLPAAARSATMAGPFAPIPARLECRRVGFCSTPLGDA